jgi:poly(3-hydroxybutyrate) depolymerase
VYLGARLWTPRTTTVHLLVGCRGELSILLDGSEVLRHASSRFRADDALATLEIGPGDHALVLRATRPGQGAWRIEVRVLDERLRPGARPALIAVGVLDDVVAADHAARAVRVSEVHRLEATGPTAHLRAWLPGGGIARPVMLDLAGEVTLEPADGVFAAEAVRRVPFPTEGRLTLAATVGARRIPLGAGVTEDRPALEAQAGIVAMLEKAPPTSRAPLAWRAAELGRVVAERDPDTAWRNELVREARQLVKAMAAGRDPFGQPRGFCRMAFISKLDDTPQPYELFVPPGYRHEGTRRWPLVVTLHGFKGNAGDYFRNTFGLARDAEGGETLLGHARHGEAPRKGPMFVVAPTGRGQAMYRHAGETDVLEVLADARRRFAIDPDRIYITGGSMGGTGAAYLPYRNPDVFAASAALAGYHDQRVREDTDHDQLSASERFLQAERSDVDWAENGLHLHTLLVRGTKDPPVEWTRSLAKRLKTLGYPYEHREPESGHNVWTETYADGAIFRYFSRFRRPSAPREVRLRTARERTRQAWWVRIDERAAPDAFADVHATIDDGGGIAVTTEGTLALTLDPGPDLILGDQLEVRIDGTAVSGPRPLSLIRTAAGWEVTDVEHPLPGHKRPGASGPIRDIYHDPLIFVVGTQDPGHTLINRLVAEHWSRPHGWTVDYPVVDDTAVTEAMIREHSLVLVGPHSSNLLTRRWRDRLPILLEDGAVTVGGRRHEGVQVGAVFVAPHPEAPDRSLLVIAGPGALGTWRSMFLPDILPDYVVFDERIAPARDRWAAGGTGATYLEEGFFGMDWGIGGGSP